MRHTFHLSGHLPALTAAGIIALCLVRGGAVAAEIRGSVVFCGQVLIPSLYPCLVLGTFLSSVGHSGFLPLVIGGFCGYPAGAAAVRAGRARGDYDRREAGRRLGLCAIGGAGYLITGVGESLLGSRREGVRLWLCQLLASILIYVAGGIRGGREASERREAGKTSAPLLPQLADALQRGTLTMLTVCGSTVLFAGLGGLWEPYLQGIPALPGVLLRGLWELSGGMCAAASLPGDAGILLCGALAGIGGSAVAIQVCAVAGDEIDVRGYLKARVISALLTPALIAVSKVVVG